MNNQQKEPPNNTIKKELAFIKLFWAVIFTILAVTICKCILTKQRNKAMIQFPADKVEAYLSECFGQDVQVTFLTSGYYNTTYKATTTLPDTAQIQFTVWWEKEAARIENGLYTNYDEKLVTYYTDKYKLSCQKRDTSFCITVTQEEISGEASPLEQCIKELWNSRYIQSGQEIELEITTEGYHFHYLTLCREEPPSYLDIISHLSNAS